MFLIQNCEEAITWDRSSERGSTCEKDSGGEDKLFVGVVLSPEIRGPVFINNAI